MAKKPFPFSVCERCCPTGGADIDLSEYVKKTDYATEEKAGIVKVQNNGIKINENHALEIECADPSNEEQNNLPLSAGDSKQIFANAIKGSAGGTSVRLDDVSPVEHDVKVIARDESQTIDNLETVTVSRYRKNLLDPAIIQGSGVGSFRREGDTFFVEPDSNGSIYGMKMPGLKGILRVGGTYVASVKEVSAYDSAAWGWRIAYKDGTYSNINYKKTLKFTVDKPISGLLFYFGFPYNGGAVTATGFQLEIGAVETEYTPYEEPETYSVSADGTVEGITSISPDMSLVTDTDGVIIECEYNRDTNKVIEKLTNAIISLGGNV